jgi:hypothetical protein
VFGSPSKKYFQKSLEFGKTVLYLIKSNGKQQTPTDKQKTILKIKLKTVLETKQKNQKRKKPKRYFRAKAIF